MVVDGRVGGLRGPTTYATVEAQLVGKKGFLRFREFCITDNTTENIDFWKRVKDYKNTFNPLHDYSPDGKAIYDEFVCIIAPRQINIPDAILESIGHAIIGGKYLSDTFVEAFNAVFGLLKSDIFPRFKLQDHGEQNATTTAAATTTGEIQCARPTRQ
jgi:hypothetical protein